MTTYRLMDGVSGRPGVGSTGTQPPTAATANSGPFINATSFAVSGGGRWFQGYWWWVAASGGQSTAATKCALWSVQSATAGAVVPGSVVTSGTLTAGQWNYIPLPSPIQLAPSLDAANTAAGSMYIAAVSTNSGPTPLTAHQFDSGSPYSAGISNGPLFAFGDQTGTNKAPFMNQGLFTTAGGDPSVTMPNAGSNGDNFWVDVQVSDTAPAGYSGSYRLWPNHSFASQPTTLDAAVAYTVATEIRLSQTCTLKNAWYYSPSGAGSLATRADVWSLSSGLSVASITSPSWSGAAGSGWVKTAFPGGTVLPAGTYRVSVYNSAGGSGGWSAKDANSNYWSTGTGTGGITWGPLYAPNLASASECWKYNGSASGATPPYSAGTQEPGQAPFAQTPTGVLAFPQLYVDGLAQNYWVDLEVTPVTASGSGALMASGII